MKRLHLIRIKAGLSTEKGVEISFDDVDMFVTRKAPPIPPGVFDPLSFLTTQLEGFGCSVEGYVKWGSDMFLLTDIPLPE